MKGRDTENEKSTQIYGRKDCARPREDTTVDGGVQRISQTTPVAQRRPRRCPEVMCSAPGCR